jgi:minor extracellular serine protease Vpr
MKSPVLLLTGTVLLLCATVVATAGTLGAAEQAKLHPYFQQVLIEQTTRTGAPVVKSASTTYDAIIYTRDPDAVRAAGLHMNSVYPEFVTAQLTLDELELAAGLGAVTYIDPGSINVLHNDVSIPEIGASLLHGGLVNNTPYKGQGAIVVIYDSGLDWKHMDFRNPSDPTKSRILAIWDQTLSPVGSESSPAGFSYGVEYTQQQINDELDGTPTGFVRSVNLNGHGTHVAGTATGNGASLNGKYTGVAPLADIIVVKGGEGSFSETRMIDGLTYAGQKATAFGKPVVINYSLGGQTGPHDGKRTYEVAMNDFVLTPGRVVVVSAGNEGDVPMHVSGSIDGGGTEVFTLTVPAYTPKSGTDNDQFTLDIWFPGNPDVTATVASPTPISFTRAAGEIGDGPDASDGTITLWNYLSSLNGQRDIYANVHDKTASTPKAGTWTISVKNNTASPISYDAWLADRTVGASTASVVGGNTDKTVGMPGTSAGAITAGSYATKWSWPAYTGQQFGYTAADRTDNISAWSSKGPTRDGRMKPDIAAPGEGISSALSSGVDTTGLFGSIHPGQKHWLMAGTSMAAPHVTGASALLLGAKSTLTASQIKTLIGSTANSDAFATGLPNNTWGSGKLDIVEALAKSLNPAATVVRKTFAYDVAGTSSTTVLAGTAKLAVRVTPDVNGRLSGIKVNVTSNSNGIVGTGNMLCEVYTNEGGVPGSKLGNTVQQALGLLSRGTYNYVQMLDANVDVTSATDYFVVLSVPGAVDTVRVRVDDGSVPASRSFRYDGITWAPYVATIPRNLRIRAIVTTATGVSFVDPERGLAQEYELLQNYPNPFNPATTIGFSIPAKSRVSLRIFNLLGQEVALLANDDLAAGKYEVRWNPEGLASGTYFYRLQAGSYVESKKLLYLK